MPVGDGHGVAWSAHGHPQGLPVVVLHGGPGSGASLTHLDFFPLDQCRVILMDQRGCGRSTPLGATQANTTAHLVHDIAALRQHLGVPAWLVVGGSWGGTLALAYAQAEPEACLGVLLRAPFLPGPAALHWFCLGAGRLRPAAHGHWLGLPALADGPARHTVPGILQAYGDAFEQAFDRTFDRAVDQALDQGDDPAGLREGGDALTRWLHWEATLERWHQPPVWTGAAPPAARWRALLARARIQLHYLQQGCFVDVPTLLAGLRGLAQVPAAIVQGECDAVCPAGLSWAVHRAWPGSVWRSVAGGTHAPFGGEMPVAMRQLVCQFVAHQCFSGTA